MMIDIDVVWWCEAGGERTGRKKKNYFIQQQNVLVEESSQSFGMDVTHRNIVLSRQHVIKKRHR